MKGKILFSFFVLLLVIPVQSQWNFVRNFPNPNLGQYLNWPGGVNNGIIVDGLDRVWLQSFSDHADSIHHPQGPFDASDYYTYTQQIRVFKSDGSEWTSISPINTFPIELSGRGNGLTIDDDGNILAASTNWISRLWSYNGEVLNSITNIGKQFMTPCVDAAGYIYTGSIFPGDMVKVYSKDLVQSYIIESFMPGFGRCIAVSADGKDIYIPRYTLKLTFHYHSNTGPTGTYTLVDTLMKGLVVENAVWDRQGQLWVNGGNSASGYSDFPYSAYTWYAYNFQTHSVVDSIKWHGDVSSDPRPRGIAFSLTGDVAYIAVFNQNQNFVQVFKKGVDLPVELQSFNVFQNNTNIELKWETATEINNFGFDIERLEIGIWNKIGFVEGAGNSNSPKSYSYVDVSAKGMVKYRLKQIDRDGKFEYSNEVEITVAATPNGFSLNQNYPNPFNPSTTIKFGLPEASTVSLKVYDIIGREVATLVNDQLSAGYFSYNFNAQNLSSGVYIYHIVANSSNNQKKSFTQVKKLVLMK